MIEALADCRQAAALPAVSRAAVHPDVQVRLAAIKALGTLGDVCCVPLLVEKCGTQDSQEAKVAALALRMLKGAGVDAAIVSSLGQAAPPVKAELIAVLADRRATQAVAALIAQAKDGELERPAAAWRALGKVARERGNLPALIQLLAELKDDDVRTEGERAIVRVARTIANPAGRGNVLLAAWGIAGDAAAMLAAAHLGRH